MSQTLVCWANYGLRDDALPPLWTQISENFGNYFLFTKYFKDLLFFVQNQTLKKLLENVIIERFLQTSTRQITWYFKNKLSINSNIILGMYTDRK